MLNGAVQELVGDERLLQLDSDQVEAALKSAVKTAVKEVVNDMVEGAIVAEAGRTK